MFEKSPITVLLLMFVTVGIYGLVWLYQCTEEMKSRGADIPSFFFILIPILNLYFIWKFYGGVEHVTKGEVSAVTVFILSLLGPLGLVSFWMVQSGFNKVAAES